MVIGIWLLFGYCILVIGYFDYKHIIPRAIEMVDVRPPAGIRLLKLFYFLLFLVNFISLLIFGRLTNTQILGHILSGYGDISVKIILAVLPLIVYYLGFIKFYAGGCYLAILYQLTFLINTILAILANIFKLGFLAPIIQIVTKSLRKPVVGGGYFLPKHWTIYSLNLIIGTIVIFYLTSRLSWYKESSKGYKGYDERLVPRHNKEFGLTYFTGNAAAGIYIRGQGSNISTGGVRFTALEPLKRGTMLELEIELPGQKEPVPARAKVIWSKGNDCGVEFLNMEKLTRKKLKDFLKG